MPTRSVTRSYAACASGTRSSRLGRVIRAWSSSILRPLYRTPSGASVVTVPREQALIRLVVLHARQALLPLDAPGATDERPAAAPVGADSIFRRHLATVH